MLWFLLISLVPCGTVTVLLYWISSEATRELVRRNLRGIAESKAAELEEFALSRLREAGALARVPTMIEAATDLSKTRRKNPVNAADIRVHEQKYLTYLAGYADTFGYPNIYLFDPDGTLLLRIKEGLDIGSKVQEGPLKATEFAGVVDRAKTLLQTELSDYQQYLGAKEPIAFIATPVLNKDGAVVGVIVLELNNEQVFEVFADYAGLGDTGETLVGTRVGDEVVAVAPLRHEKDAAFRIKVRLGELRSVALQQAVQGQRGSGQALDYREKPCVANWMYLPSFRWGMVVKQDVDEAYAPITRQWYAAAILLAVTVVGVVLVALVVARTLSRPVRAAARVAQSVAAGDLTEQVTVHASGETGQLLASIQKMSDYLRGLIGKIQMSSVTLMSTATEIAATSKQQDQTIAEFGASTNQAAAAVKQIAATSRELLETMNQVSDTAAKTATMASEGQASLNGMDKTMRHLADSTGSINSKLAIISERARNINLVVTAITKVADQTNLLSINAAIEAEKAGEYGLGFLVVAREIRRLADQTAVATLDIERMVTEMQQSVSTGVMEMDKFSEQVRHGVEEVGRIGGQLGEIISAVKLSTERFEQVNQGMNAQSLGAEQIREAMIRLSDGANQTARSLSEFNQATVQLRDAVGGLKQDVSWFRITRDEKGSVPDTSALSNSTAQGS
jgi:methyl-accepting chemotaxis protein WspA